MINIDQYLTYWFVFFWFHLRTLDLLDPFPSFRMGIASGHHVVTALASEHLEASCDIGRPRASIEEIWTTFSVGKGETIENPVRFYLIARMSYRKHGLKGGWWTGNFMGPFLQRYVLWIFCRLSPSPIENYLIDVDLTRPTSELRAAFQTVDFGDLPEAAVESEDADVMLTLCNPYIPLL